MFVILLKFSVNKAEAGAHMDSHNKWLKAGFDDGVFLLAGSIKPGLGGAILAHNATAAALEARVNEDPFVAQDVVSAEILEITPAKADQRLEFLLF
ncbi:MAG: YciI family protein [Pseudomonadota bacterium]